jgi:uncharacterized membrane protein YhaH (DUF805 family)
MHDDGDVEYSRYGLAELEEALARINRQKYPKNYANLCAAYEQLTGNPVDSFGSAPPSSVDLEAKHLVSAPNPLSVYFHWRGRISRKSYWLFGLLPAAILLMDRFVLLGLVDAWASWLMLFVGSAPSIMIDIKRSHDLGRSGWFTLLLFVPLLNIWPLIELGFIKGNDGVNRYGPPALW